MFDAPAGATADLRRRVERSLELASRAIELAGGETHLDLVALEAPPVKIIAETAILLAWSPGTTVDSAVARARELLQRLEPLARNNSVAFGLCLHPAVARDWAAGHILLAAAGLADARYDTMLDRALAGPLSAARERVPYRALEQDWFDHLRGAAPPAADVIARTALGVTTDLLTGTRDDLYAVTHSLFYATDFGALTAPVPRPAHTILAEMESAVAGAMDDDDFDLAAELLMSWPILGQPWSPAASFAFAVLARVEDEVGVLPSLAIDLAGYQRQSVLLRADFVTATTYHTGLVMGLLCALTLASGRLRDRPDPLMVTTDHSVGVPGPQWRRDLGRLTDTEQQALRSFTLDTELRRAVRTLDLARVRSLLAGAVGTGVRLGPLAVQASELLQRVAAAA